MMAENKVQKILELELQPEIKLTDNAPEWAQQIAHLISANHNALVKQMHTIEISHDSQSLEIENLKKKNTDLEKRVVSLELKQKIQDERTLKQEIYARKDNLIFHGLEESVWEKSEDRDQKLREYITSLNLDGDMELVKIYRLGQGRSRPILVQFRNPQDKDLVWKARPRAHYATIKTDTPARKQGPSLFITQDYPQEIQNRRRILIPVLNKAKQLDEYRDNSFIRDDKLYINRQVYTVDTTDQLPSELNPQNISTPTNGHITAFWGRNSPLSNHHPSYFVIDGEPYNSVEQFYMMRMAHFAGATEIAANIRKSTDPAKYKRLTKAIPEDVKDKWNKVATRHMAEGLSAKFQQNDDLKDFLLETKNTELVEASPNDRFWGVGITITDPRIFNKEQWKGKNNLGNLLGQIRETLRA
jgi:ribA/ribD-fused uncharacterized protein